MAYQSETKNCQNCKGEFVIEPDDFGFYEKLNVPPPTWCPHCRFIRKITFMNQRSLYKRECGNCKKSIVSMYHPDTLINTWCIGCYVGDTWDARDYGREYDFTKFFFEQLKDLKLSVPHRTLDQNERNGEGCEYANYCYTSKNIYLSYVTGTSENIKYCTHVLKYNKNCVDSLIIRANDRIYECVQASQNYNSSFLVESEQCVESHFLYDCSNCINCFMSSNLRNKSYVFRNQQLTREEYQKEISTLNLNTYIGQLKAKVEFKELAKNAIHKYAHLKNSVDAVGDFIENSKNVYHCYGVKDSENSKYVYFSANTTKDAQDLIATGKLEECYEFTSGGRGASRVVFSLSCGGSCKNLSYCIDCRGCSDCFGCVGLSKKQYCIFNKQYSKEEYKEMIEKIKNHMNDIVYSDSIGRKYPFGEFFPTEFSPFAYNETVAFEEEPLTKNEVIKNGYKWRDLEVKSHTATQKSSELPDDIKDVPDSICTEVIECPNMGRVETLCTSAYKITVDELAFYRQMNLPIPHFCPNCRYYERLVWKNPFRFYKRECMCEIENHEHKGNPRQGGARCKNEFETMYAPERKEKVFCKNCYQKEVY